MKATLSAHRVALLALALGTASVTATFAQSTNTPSTTAPTSPVAGKHRHHHHDSVLTENERAQLKAAREAAYAADPSLKTEHDGLKAQFKTLKGQGKDASTKHQKKTLHKQKQDFETRLHLAEMKADPTVTPILTKLEAAHKHGRHSE